MTRASLDAFVQGFVSGNIPDYQVAAWLMAVCFQPLNSEETAWLTHSMTNSGRRLTFSSGKLLTADKHSTGGVGDKTSLIVAPIVAAAGVRVPMMSGRGLGHTGGTLDKLESIAGMNVRLDLDRFQKQVESVGLSFIGQTEEVCPADRKLYALRDVTGTVESTPLICASIMSKKLAEGCQALVLDVKFGSGAFMKSRRESEDLAIQLLSIAKSSGLRTAALLTNMNAPLGRFVGNAVEVRECIDIMRRTQRYDGKTADDTESLSLELAAHMLLLSGRSADLEEARALALSLLDSGQAFEKFSETVRAQGGDLDEPMPSAKCRRKLLAQREGFFHFTDVEKIGMGAIVLGAGRQKSSDVIDVSAGIEIFVRDGQRIHRGDPIFEVSAAKDALISESESFFNSSFTIDDVASTPSPLVAKVFQ